MSAGAGRGHPRERTPDAPGPRLSSGPGVSRPAAGGRRTPKCRGAPLPPDRGSHLQPPQTRGPSRLFRQAGARVTARAGPCGRGLAAPGPSRPEAGARPPGTPRRDPSPPRPARGLSETRAEPVPPSKAAPLSAEPGGTRRPRRTWHFAAQHGAGRLAGRQRPGGRDHPAEPRDGGFLCLLPPAGGRGRFPGHGNQIPGTLLKRWYLSWLMKCM